MGEAKVEDKKGKKRSGSGKGLKILVILLILIIAVGGGFCAYLLIFKKPSIAAAGQSSTLPSNAVVNNEGTSKYTAALDDFLVNLSDEGGKKYMKITICIGYDNKKLATEIEEKTPMIRDAINSVLRSKKSTDMSAKGVEDLKAEIGNRINPLFENGRVNHVYFSNIIIQ